MQLFTVEQANRTLPLVRRIVEDIVRSYAAWQERVRDFELAQAVARPDAPDPAVERLQREAQGLAADIAAFVAELELLGVEFKGFEQGLVDFPAMLGGRQVCLCWQLGEPAVEYWHDRDAGFAGRRPFAPHGVASSRADS